MPENIIFLDIDGVLNRHGGDMQGRFTEPDCVDCLNKIVAETKAKIVVCSAWRYLVHNGYMTVPGFATFMRTHGVQGDVIDVTRPSSDSYIDGSGVEIHYDSGEPRYKQIASWLKRPLVEIQHYAIIDDDPGAFGSRPGVWIRDGKGLTMEDATQAIEILRGG